MKNYTIYLVSNKPDRYATVQQSLLPELLYYFDGSGATSFSKLINQCVENSPTEIVIISGDKSRPKQSHITQIIELLDMGFGLVGLNEFGLIGFKKELLRRIGMFDERYINKGYEDFDIILRLIIANIAFYLSEDVECISGECTWNPEGVGNHWVTKWIHHWGRGPNPYLPVFEKSMAEENYHYNLGPSVPTKFLPLSQTYANGQKINWKFIPFLMTTVESAVPIGFVNNGKETGQNYNIYLISNKPEKYPKIQQSLLPELLHYFDGSGATSFSQLVNRCVEACPTEIVIITSDKSYPKQEHVRKMVNLIEQGHGIVGLYRFGFFGFKKELLRRIGMFDERFLGGGWEDNDILLRATLANISFYMTEEIEYKTGVKSSWNNHAAGRFWHTKWITNPNYIKNNLPRYEKTLREETYSYNLGRPVPTKFLPSSESFTNTHLREFLDTTIISQFPVGYINSSL